MIIADISGSMEKYARLLLQFLYSVAHSLPQVECFVFGTRLTRITGQLKLRNIDQAIDQASREVVDWAGGTRIGERLREFNRHWGRRVLGRGAVALLISDGWEQGDPELLGDEMRRLQRRCHRLIWLNPLLGRETYQPRVGGMQAVLPYIEIFCRFTTFKAWRRSPSAWARWMGEGEGRARSAPMFAFRAVAKRNESGITDISVGPSSRRRRSKD